MQICAEEKKILGGESCVRILLCGIWWIVFFDFSLLELLSDVDVKLSGVKEVVGADIAHGV